VVHEDQVGFMLCRKAEKVGVGADAGDDGVRLDGARDLQAVGPEVLERTGIEQSVQPVDDLRNGSDRSTLRPTGPTALRTGCTKPMPAPLRRGI